MFWRISFWEWVMTMNDKTGVTDCLWKAKEKNKNVGWKIKSLNALCKIVCQCFGILIFFYLYLIVQCKGNLFHSHCFRLHIFQWLFFFFLFFIYRMKKHLAQFKWKAGSCSLLSVSIISFNINVLVLLVPFNHLYFKMYLCFRSVALRNGQ